jgi:hypothetical protein
MSTINNLTFSGSFSAAMLYTRPGSFQPLFSPQPVHDALFFDEGPRPALTKTATTASLSGAINTSAIDAYAQGIEITQQVRYDAGIVKIWSGEPGHKLLRSYYGMDNAVQCTLQACNINQINSSVDTNNVDLVLSVYRFEPNNKYIGYIDNDIVNMIQKRTFQYKFNVISPFKDETLIRNVPAVKSESADMIKALVNMSGSRSTDSYIHYNERSAPCGWYYDNNTTIGTDSLTFGGTTY